MSDFDLMIKEARSQKTDIYLQGLLMDLEMYDLVLKNPGTFGGDHIKRAEERKKETLKYIEKRMAIPMDQRL